MKSARLREIRKKIVAPLIGAWIEIVLSLVYPPRSPVAPLIGAGIEISIWLY
ncbi:hypothetical protein [Bacillus mycoides]|uniref:hypothetical protein n=1 Tax=Bacillus mycoides TaxID=1405 RepID=UPI000A27AE65|nr:hypothetical protein BTJ48_03334 [Bacillus mycoides]